jgi:hypothetical protein
MSTTIETGERRDDPACRQRWPFGHPATSTGADELTSLVVDPLFCHRYGQAALATEPAVSSRLAGAARCALREPVDEEVEQELFGEVLDWRNARLADGVQRALEPRAPRLLRVRPRGRRRGLGCLAPPFAQTLA